MANFYVLLQFFEMGENPKAFYLDTWFITRFLMRVNEDPTATFFTQPEIERFRDTYLLIPEEPCAVFFFAKEPTTSFDENISGVLFDYQRQQCVIIGRERVFYGPTEGHWAPAADLWSAIANQLFDWKLISNSDHLQLFNANWGLVSMGSNTKVCAC